MRGFLICALVLLLAACAPAGLAPQPSSPAPSAAPALPSDTAAPAASPTLTHTPTSTLAPTETPPPTPTLTATPVPPVRFAVIGDYGLAGTPEAEVAALVLGWQPDFIVTVGDNNYPSGEAETIDLNIGQYYHSYIAPYSGAYGAGAESSRFFPTLGNHDYYSDLAQPYFDYFSLPGNERYYDFTWGALHFFLLNSNEYEPDGVGRSSAQAAWLKTQLAASTSPWQIVVFHHAPYASGYYGGTDWMRWPFGEWGADAVLAGHDHVYERLLVDGIPYFVNGLGGGGRYNFGEVDPHSSVRYNANHGAMLVTASAAQVTFQFYTRTGELVDTYVVLPP